MANPTHKKHPAHESDAGVSVKNRFAMRRLDFVIILTAVLLVGFWVYQRAKHTFGGVLGRPLRVGIVPWPGYVGGLVANGGLKPNKDSIFWQHKLLVEFVEKEKDEDLLRDFETGEIDVIWRTVDTLAQQAPEFQKKNINAKAFLQVDWSRGGDAIIARAGIDKIEDLEGARVAVPQATSEWLFEYSLKNSSLTDEARKAIRQQSRKNRPDSNKQAFERFVKEEVDVAVLYEPLVTQAIEGRSGSHKLFDTSNASRLIADVMVAKQEFIDQYRPAIVAFIDGWLDGTTEANKDPMLAVKYLRQETDFANLSVEKTQELLGVTAWATLSDNAEMFGLAAGKAQFDILFDEASSVWKEAEDMKDPIPAAQARDTNPLQEVYGKHGFHRPLEQKPLSCASDKATIETKLLTMGFQPNKAEITPTARDLLNENEALFVSANNFCIQADVVEGDSVPNAAEIAKARENAVIEYLRAHYSRAQSQFASASTKSEQNFDEKHKYVRLRLTATVKQP